MRLYSSRQSEILELVKLRSQAENLGQVWSSQNHSKCLMGVVIAGWSRPDFQCSQEVKRKNLIGQNLDPGCRLKYMHALM